MTLSERYLDLLARMDDFIAASAEVEAHDEQAPSLLLLGANPHGPGKNTRTRICGNVRHLAQVLAKTLADPEAEYFMEALGEALRQEQTRFSEN